MGTRERNLACPWVGNNLPDSPLRIFLPTLTECRVGSPKPGQIRLAEREGF